MCFSLFFFIGSLFFSFVVVNWLILFFQVMLAKNLYIESTLLLMTVIYSFQKIHWYYEFEFALSFDMQVLIYDMRSSHPVQVKDHM